jgi:hypothetical protein
MHGTKNSSRPKLGAVTGEQNGESDRAEKQRRQQATPGWRISGKKSSHAGEMKKTLVHGLERMTNQRQGWSAAWARDLAKTIMAPTGRVGTDQALAGKSARAYGTVSGKASSWFHGPEMSIGRIPGGREPRSTVTRAKNTGDKNPSDTNTNEEPDLGARSTGRKIDRRRRPDRHRRTRRTHSDLVKSRGKTEQHTQNAKIGFFFEIKQDSYNHEVHQPPSLF